MALERRSEIKDFIGVFDGFVTDEACDAIIHHLHEMNKAGMVYTGKEPGLAVSGNASVAEQAMFFPRPAVIIQPFFKTFWDSCYKQYMDQYPILTTAGTHSIFSMRLIRCPIGGSDAKWHTEELEKINPSRVTSMMVFLNDVNEGGDIEFTNQHRRIQARKGRMVIWPAAWTHTYKAHTPISNDKYYLTTTLEIVA